MMLLVETLLTALLASLAPSAVESVTKQSEFDREVLNTTTSEGWNCDTVFDDCSILTVVKYHVPEKQFTVVFNCNKPPFWNEHLDKVFRKVTHYHMSGRAARSSIGFGLEYLRFPEQIKLLALEGYCLETLGNDTFQKFHVLQQLELTACKVRHALSDGFRSLTALERLIIEHSAFVEMNPSLLVSLVQLKELTVENCTGINFTLNSLANIAKIEVKNSAVLNLSSIFDSLPVTLEVIDVVNVSSQHNATLVLTTTDEGQSAAKRITVVRCGFDSIAVKNMPLLVSLNLSINSLSESTVRLVNLPALVMLVLSHNAIGAVTHTLLRFESSSLDTIDLSHNRIAYLHPNAFDDAHSLRLVNLSYNLLLNMEDFRPHARLDRIEMDNNPWDCSWLLRVHSSNPTLFRTFRYSKRFDILSALGLPCLFHISSTDPPNDQGQPASTTPVRHPQGKIFPRAENISNTQQPRFTIANPLKAIITIFVGVIISNVVLLLYNRYRNILHEPFYRGRSRSAKGVVIEKCTSFWYEVPVSNEATAIPMNHIYEEIREPKPKCEVYDALNFQRDRPPKADDIVDSERSVS